MPEKHIAWEDERKRKPRRQLAEMIAPDLVVVHPIGVSIGGRIPSMFRIPHALILEQAADGDAAEDVHAVQRCGRGRWRGEGRGRWRDQAGGGRGHEDEVSGGTARASAERSREYPCFSYL